jgi:hypothetical protein
MLEQHAHFAAQQIQPGRIQLVHDLTLYFDMAALRAQPTPEDVARATTRTVVISSLMIWWLDFMMTALMFSK